jgi:hypothetical protein
MLSPEARIFNDRHVAYHLALTGKPQRLRPVLMRWKAQPAFFPEIRRGYFTRNLNRTGAAGSHSATVDHLRASIVRGDAVSEQYAAQGIAPAAAQLAVTGWGFKGYFGHDDRFEIWVSEENDRIYFKLIDKYSKCASGF